VWAFHEFSAPVGATDGETDPLSVHRAHRTPPVEPVLGGDRRYPGPSSDEERVMAIDPEELEEIPPQGHVRVVYTGPVAPHWEIHRVFGDQRAIDEFRQRAMARLQLLPVYDPQFRRNRERVARDAEREHLILEWDLGDEPE
jgi:hypothetical protein